MKKFLYTVYLFYRYSFGKVKHYHQGPSKSGWSVFTDLLKWMIREGEFNTMYYAFGLNRKGISIDQYAGRKTILALKNIVERKLKEQAGCRTINYDVVTKDKFYANSVFEANGIACLHNLALISNKKVVYTDGHAGNIDDLMRSDNFILKNTILEAGEGVLVCNRVDNLFLINNKEYNEKEFTELLGNKKWVLQTRYRSSIEIRAINASALNTTRIVTILNGHDRNILQVFRDLQHNAVTDSWSQGSVICGN